MELDINARTGELIINEYKITSKSIPHGLPEFFKVGEEMQILVLRDKVPCIFASAIFEDENLITKIDLRFERNILVSIFIELTDKNKNYDSAVNYYGSVNEREILHLSWLKNKLGKNQEKYTPYNWGNVGIAQDPSAGVHIFLHNKNNLWAKSK